MFGLLIYISTFLFKAFMKRHPFRLPCGLFLKNLLLCTQCIFIQRTRLLPLQNMGHIFFLILCASPKQKTTINKQQQKNPNKKPSGGLPLKWTRAPHSHMLTHSDSYNVSPLQILSFYRQVENNNNNNHSKNQRRCTDEVVGCASV